MRWLRHVAVCSILRIIISSYLIDMKTFHRILDFFPVWVLALAFLAGFLYALPPMLIKKAAEQEGRFFVLPNLNHLSDDALYYLPRAREIYQGHFPSEMHFSEYKDKAWFVYPPLPQVVTAGFMVLTRGDVSSAVIGLMFVFAIINFLCFYIAGRALLGSRLWAAAVAAAALFTHAALRMPAMFYQKGVATDIIANVLPYLRVPMGELSLVRIDDPLLTMPLYIISFLLLFRFSLQPTAKRAVALGVALGILSYAYLYYWVAIFAIAGVLFLYDAWRCWRKASYKEMKPWAVFYGVFAVLFVPQIANFLIFRRLPGGPDYILRKGIETGRHLRLSVYPDYIFYVLAGAAALFLFRRACPETLFRRQDARRSRTAGRPVSEIAEFRARRPGGERGVSWDTPSLSRWASEPKLYDCSGIWGFRTCSKTAPAARLTPVIPRRFAIAVLVGMVLLWNVQIVTGFNMEPFHWWKAFAPLLFLLVGAIVKAACDRMSYRPSMRRAVQVALIVLILSMSVKKTLNAAAFVHLPEETVRSYSVPRSIAASWKWINASVPPGSAIITPSLVSSNQISIFTHADPWMAAPLNSLAPNAAMEQRFVEAHKILGASSDEMLMRLAGPPFVVPKGICPDPCTRDRDHFRDRFEFSFEFYYFGLLYGVMFSPALTFDAITKPADGSIPPATLEHLREDYAAYHPRPDQFPTHTYVYVGPWERLLSKKAGDAFAGVKPVFANEDVQIYRIQ